MSAIKQPMAKSIADYSSQSPQLKPGVRPFMTTVNSRADI